MRLILPVLLLSVFSLFGFADTIHVPADEPSIQQAIDAAVDWDTVLVAPGTYVENIVIEAKIVWVKNTLALCEAMCSEALFEPARERHDLTVIDKPGEIDFDHSGTVVADNPSARG